MYKIKGFIDYYNERGEYRKVETYRSNVADAIEEANKYEKALVLNLNRPRSAFAFGLEYQKGF